MTGTIAHHPLISTPSLFTTSDLSSSNRNTSDQHRSNKQRVARKGSWRLTSWCSSTASSSTTAATARVQRQHSQGCGALRTRSTPAAAVQTSDCKRHRVLCVDGNKLEICIRKRLRCPINAISRVYLVNASSENESLAHLPTLLRASIPTPIRRV